MCPFPHCAMMPFSIVSINAWACAAGGVDNVLIALPVAHDGGVIIEGGHLPHDTLWLCGCQAREQP